MTRVRPAQQPVPANPRDDRGTTLVELMVAIGIFSILMAIVGSASLALLSSIREATARSETQTSTQNAMEWVSRMLQFAQAPDVTTSVMPEATATAVTVYSYPGLGSALDVPWKVRLSTVTADGMTSVVSDAWAPVRTGTTWTWDSTPRRRTLLTVPAVPGGSPLSLRYFACTPTQGCDDVREVTPGASGPLALGALEVPSSILVELGDPSLPYTRVTQTVGLVNQS